MPAKAISGDERGRCGGVRVCLDGLDARGLIRAGQVGKAEVAGLAGEDVGVWVDRGRVQAAAGQQLGGGDVEDAKVAQSGLADPPAEHDGGSQDLAVAVFPVGRVDGDLEVDDRGVVEGGSEAVNLGS
jgi:hypothetical protein